MEAETEKGAEEIFQVIDQKCMDDFFPRALAVMEKNGVDRSRLELVTIEDSLSVPSAIVQYAVDNDFGTIVMGRRGSSKSLFTGSVSRSILRKAGDAALWIIP